MNKLKIFLEKSYNTLKDWKSLKEIHIVLGNESCDLDSTICSLAYGYFISQQLKLDNSSDLVVFPVLNVSAEDFSIRTEHCSLLKNIEIDLNRLIYRSKINFGEMIKEKKGSMKTYLVDHHVLSKNDQILHDTVFKIFDHRPVDASAKWSSDVESRIEPVGSCATLITDEILKVEGVLFKELAYLLYCTIVFDTLAVLPENKKATTLDIKTAEKLEEKFNFQEPRLTLFQKIVDLHADVSNLTARQLLIRDLKFVKNIPLPGLPMLVETFLKLVDVEESLKDMAVKNQAPFVVLIGIEAKPDVKRDVALFAVENNSKLKQLLVSELKDKTEFQFEEIPCDIKNIVLLRQLNIEKSRKQIMPIIQNFVSREIK